MKQPHAPLSEAERLPLVAGCRVGSAERGNSSVAFALIH